MRFSLSDFLTRAIQCAAVIGLFVAAVRDDRCAMLATALIGSGVMVPVSVFRWSNRRTWRDAWGVFSFVVMFGSCVWLAVSRRSP